MQINQTVTDNFLLSQVLRQMLIEENIHFSFKFFFKGGTKSYLFVNIQCYFGCVGEDVLVPEF